MCMCMCAVVDRLEYIAVGSFRRIFVSLLVSSVEVLFDVALFDLCVCVVDVLLLTEPCKFHR